MRFSIRDLLWATLVVGLGLAWWLEYRAHCETENKRLVTDAKRLEAVAQVHRQNKALKVAFERVDQLRAKAFPEAMSVMFTEPWMGVVDERLVEP